jgi:hypothetical protein
MVFMYNTKCDFNKKTGQIEFGGEQWVVPIQSIKLIKMKEVKDKRIEFTISTDLTQ